MKKRLILPILALFVFTGCKQYFEPNPNNIDKKVFVSNINYTDIADFTKNTTTFKNGEVLPYNIKLPKGFIAIDKDLAKNGSILLVNGKKIKFNSLIVTAKKRNNLIAILFGDNHFELYDLNQDKVIFNNKLGDVLALRKFVAQPYFYNDLLLIPSLDGKLIVFDLKLNKIIKTIVVSKKDYFNNIIYLNVKNDNLIVASRDRILVISPNMVFSKEYNIKHILVDDNNIYVFTIEGDVFELNFALKELAHKEFKYANIISPVFYNNKIYFLIAGTRNFIVKLDKDLNQYKIDELIEKAKENNCYNIYFLQTDVTFNNGTYYIGEYILKLK